MCVCVCVEGAHINTYFKDFSNFTYTNISKSYCVGFNNTNIAHDALVVINGR
jgi:hypothetical protein